MNEPTTLSAPVELDDESRRVAAAAVAAAAIGWWPAFTFGVYGVIFFEQRLSLWAVSLTVFLVLGLAKGPRVWLRPKVYSLLVPSLWLLISLLIPAGSTSPASRALFWFGVVITVLGMPILAAFMVRLLIPHADRLARREALATFGVVILIMLAAYGVGTQHPRLLTCDDFSISGNYAPVGCTVGEAPTAER